MNLTSISYRVGRYKQHITKFKSHNACSSLYACTPRNACASHDKCTALNARNPVHLSTPKRYKTAMTFLKLSNVDIVWTYNIRYSIVQIYRAINRESIYQLMIPKFFVFSPWLSTHPYLPRYFPER